MKNITMLAVYFYNVIFNTHKSYVTSHKKDKHYAITSSQTTIPQEKKKKCLHPVNN